MKRTLQLVLCLFFFSLTWTSIGQTETNIQALQDLSVQFNSEFEQNRAEVIEFARIHNIPIRFENEDALFEMQYIDEFGMPQYYKTSNKIAAASVSTSRVNTNGGAGLNLNGSGMTVHEWDGGGVLTTHQEFGNRVTIGDGTTGTHYHSTHVAGTMIAYGIDPAAKGMAPEANLKAFDWNNDDSEMATEAASGALASNHSYGLTRGWSYNSSNGSWYWYGATGISQIEDYLFGFYDANAQSLDNIAFNAPNYLICKSAGNDRGEYYSGTHYVWGGSSWVTSTTVRGADGGTTGYDCVGSEGTAKNILTVGAVYDIPNGYAQPSDVIMSSFSAWGPADDGRIKPDIVANGIGLYSTFDGSNTDYYSISGTSMATPSATGSLILLQEHFENLNSGAHMKAATLKALVIHTADEAGPNLGPDYMFGWGLLNTEKAANKISEDQTNDVIIEYHLPANGTYTKTITATSGYPIKATVVWTDPSHTPPSAALDPSTAMLVNDLDLRITQGATTHRPWILNRLNPSAAATRTAENNIDNVEVVLIENPVAGQIYTITVDHDGTITGGRDFSLIISGYPLPPLANFYASKTQCQVNETVTLTDATTNNPTSWLWSISPSTFNFVNSTSSTSQNPQVVFTQTGLYTVSLYAQNASGNSTKVRTNYIFATNAPTGYCEAYSTNPYGTINRVQFGTIDNSSTYTNVGSAHPNDKYYENFTNLITDIYLTETKSLIVSSIYTDAGLDLGVWIDWNRDGDFDDTGENVVCVEDGGGVGTFDITTPGTAGLGHTRMRLRIKYYNAGCGSTCGSTANGEVEDYTINILPIPTIAPVADFEADPTTTIINTTVKFTDKSSNLPTSWLWSFNPSTVTYTGGTSATSKNPQVKFTAAGIYEVTLYSENAYGNDTKINSDYITVYNLPPSSYCAASGGGDEYISGVSLNTINNTGTTADGYHDYTSLATDLELSEIYSLTVTNGNPYLNDDLGVWIDWNQDGDFDDTGENIVCDVDVNGGQGTFSFTIPSTAQLGSTRMRVRIKYTGSDCGSPCGTTDSGEVEDYTIIVTQRQNIWKGFSTDWANSNNWSTSTVPSGNYNAIIPISPVGGSFPEIALGTNATCNKLTILNGANVKVFGNLTVSGKLSNNTGTSGLVIKSNASGTGSLIANTSYVEASVERYFTGGKWHLFGAPVANQDAHSIYFNHNPDVWLKKYIESTDTWTATISDLDTPFPMGRGFAIWVKTGYTATSSFKDQLNNDDFLVSGLEFTDASHGYNLLANPFASALDWDQGSWVRTNLDGSVWVYDPVGGSYRTRNSVGVGSLTDGIIPAVQGFFVRATSSGASISIPADARVHSSLAFYKSGNKNQDENTGLTVAAIEVSKGIRTDEAWFVFDDACTETFDNGWDVSKFFGDYNAPQIYAFDNGQILSIDALPVLNKERIVPMNFRAGADGHHTLILRKYENFEEAEIWLEDLKEEVWQQLILNMEYVFDGYISDSPERFLLHFNPRITGIIQNPESNYAIYSWNNSIYIKNPELNASATVEIVDMYGRIIYQGKIQAISLNKIDLRLSNCYLVVRLTDNGSTTIQKVFIR